MNTISPVIPGLENYEITLGGQEAGQPEYDPLPALRSPEGIVLTRWQPTDEERQQIAGGADLYLSVLTFNQPFQAVKLEVGEADDPNRVRDTKRQMRLDDEYELRSLLYETRELLTALKAKQLEVLNASPELKELAEKASQTQQLLERKKAAVFSNKPSQIEIVQ